MSHLQQQSDDYYLIEPAIRFLETNVQRQPGLEEIAASVNLSEYHFQRLFTRWVGISPKRFLQYLTKENAKRLLEGSASVLETAYETGLSSPGRLHDLFVTCEAVTPGEYKARGAGLLIRYGFHPTPFGECILAATDRGICYLTFVKEDGLDAALDEVTRWWGQAIMVEDTAGTRPLAARVFTPESGSASTPLPIHLRGTNFQIKVWEALLSIPAGKAVTYSDIAAHLGAPRSARAVGNAVGANPIPVVVPCHRVLRKEGDFGGYRYGAARKMALLGWENVKRNP
jgi:AraC family transcriptional regulator of adaptative response/methylated-DNA-[protein]-cysteine methyltransferase